MNCLKCSFLFFLNTNRTQHWPLMRWDMSFQKFGVSSQMKVKYPKDRKSLLDVLVFLLCFCIYSNPWWHVLSWKSQLTLSFLYILMMKQTCYSRVIDNCLACDTGAVSFYIVHVFMQECSLWCSCLGTAAMVFAALCMFLCVYTIPYVTHFFHLFFFSVQNANLLGISYVTPFQTSHAHLYIVYYVLLPTLLYYYFKFLFVLI